MILSGTASHDQMMTSVSQKDARWVYKADHPYKLDIGSMVECYLIQRFKTGIFFSLYPYQCGDVRLCTVSTEDCKSSMAEAYRMSVGSDQAVFMRANPNGIPVVALTPAGSVIIGYPDQNDQYVETLLCCVHLEKL